MDKYETRRQNLSALLQTHCGGRAATLADLIGRSPSYVSRMLYPEGKDGKKRIGEDMRDLIEEALSLPQGTLDKEPGESSSASTRAVEAPRVVEKADASTRSANSANETTLERLDATEKSMLDLFRRATDEGKTVVHRVLLTVPKIDD